MKLSLLFILSAMTTAVVARSEMKTKPSPANPAEAAECKIDGEKSACGLPSNVVIDMSKTKVQRSDSEWKAMLTPIQYRVARQQGTERPFDNQYWDHHEDGVYFSVCSDTPLF